MAALESLVPLRSESTASLIATRIRAVILRGELPPGSQLTEAEVASRLEVSRGPVREALQRLVQEGILVSIRNRGVFVPELGAEDVVDVYLARAAIETAAVRAIIAAGDADLEPVEVVLRRMISAARGGRWSNVAQADFEFHQALVHAAGSARLERMLATLMVESRLCMLALEGVYRASVEIVDEHRKLLETVVRRDERAAVRLVSEHMKDAAKRLVHLFELRGGDGAAAGGGVVDGRAPQARSTSVGGAGRRKQVPSPS